MKSLDLFTRFLEVAALANAQIVNVSAIARDAAVARPTVQGYFEILVDTLVGVWLPAWRARAKVKEVAHPKFHFFDTGVVRALARRAAASSRPTCCTSCARLSSPPQPARSIHAGGGRTAPR